MPNAQTEVSMDWFLSHEALQTSNLYCVLWIQFWSVRYYFSFMYRLEFQKIIWLRSSQWVIGFCLSGYHTQQYCKMKTSDNFFILWLTKEKENIVIIFTIKFLYKGVMLLQYLFKFVLKTIRIDFFCAKTKRKHFSTKIHLSNSRLLEHICTKIYPAPYTASYDYINFSNTFYQILSWVCLFVCLFFTGSHS